MISYNGFNNNNLTFKTDTKLDAGKPVKIATGDSVAYCDENDIVCGVTVSSTDTEVAVAINGYVELPCEDTTVTVGYVSLCADDKGGVKKGTGRQVLVLKADTTNKICGFIL